MANSNKAKQVIDALRAGLIVSCQPVPDGPLDTTAFVVASALAAEAAGAAGLRIEGRENVAAVAKASRLPVIGLIKRDLNDSPVRITPLLEDVAALIEAGAVIVAIDCTARARPVPVDMLIRDIKRRGAIAMADIATEAEAQAAIAAGVDVIGTTLSGYTGGLTPALPDFELVRRCARLGAPVFAEGRYNTPALAGEAVRQGAHAVVVGSAITRVEYVTGWFCEAISAARKPVSPVLTFDIGGTKTLAALVQGRDVIERATMPTPRAVGSAGWIDVIAGLVPAQWHGRYDRAIAAVSGLVENGRWSSLNPDTLPIPPAFPLCDRLGAALHVPCDALNDAQAAAWGEFRFGAGNGADMVFLTISSGIGGGMVLDGRLRRGARGLAGSLGQVRGDDDIRLETRASGFGIAAAASACGHPVDARAVFEAARDGQSWARDILRDAVARLAGALADLQALVDPACIVIGGGVGLAPGFLDQLRAALATRETPFIPDLRAAQLGADAGIVGAADFAVRSTAGSTGT